jgi:hypothetical protein
MQQNATLLEHRSFGHAHRAAFATRGVVLVPEDLTLYYWLERAHRAGLTTIALHHGSSPKTVARTVRLDAGQTCLERCRQLGLQVEYELHTMKELLPRDRFSKDPALFRANAQHADPRHQLVRPFSARAGHVHRGIRCWPE